MVRQSWTRRRSTRACEYIFQRWKGHIIYALGEMSLGHVAQETVIESLLCIAASSRHVKYVAYPNPIREDSSRTNANAAMFMGERQLSAVRSMANAYLQNDNIPKDPMTEAALQLEVDWTLKKHGKLGLRVKLENAQKMTSIKRPSWQHIDGAFPPCP